MLITAIEKEKQEILEQGIEQGIEQGRSAMQLTIEQLLQARFGNVTEAISTALTNCTLDQLQSLVNHALDAPDLDAFWAIIPQTETPSEEVQTEADPTNEDSSDSDQDKTDAAD